MNILIADDKSDLKLKLSNIISEKYHTRKNPNFFNIGLSGGSLVQLLSEVIISSTTINLKNWRIFFCDERVVSKTSSDSTCKQYYERIGHLLRPEQLISIEESSNVDEVARNYAQKLEKCFPQDTIPIFDLILLGLGEDGHTCSIFPNNHKSFEDAQTKQWVIPVISAPKPPPKRISFSYEILNNAYSCCFVVTGSNKAAIVEEILVNENQNLPATAVKLKNGNLFWLLDKSAAKNLKA